MDAQIAKTTQNLTTAAEMRNTTQMLMQPNANWEEYLTPAPLSIAIMAEIVFISSNADFSINKNPPSGGFKHIKYPESFRACLMQICNLGWQAFNMAHKNMDQIRIHTSSVPDYMKAAVKILFNAPDDVIEAMLPNQLDNIRNIADECVILADSVEKKYSDVIDLIQELLEACINAEHFYGTELEKVKMKLEENKLREKTAKELNEISKKSMESMSKQLEEAQDQYKSSMDSLPSGWDMIGMDLVEGLAQTTTTLLNGFVSLAADPVSKATKSMTAISQVFKGDGSTSGGTSSGGTSSGGTSTSSGGTSSEVIKDVGERMVSEIATYSKSGEFVSLASSFNMYISDKAIDWKVLYDQKSKSAKTSWTQSQYERVSHELQKMQENEVRMRALSLCKSGIAICEQLAKYAPDQKCEEKITKDLIAKIQKLYDDSLRFDSTSKSRSATPALAPKPPMMYKEQEKSGKTASQKATENARFRIEQSREQLKNTREYYEKAVQNMEKNQKELNEVLIEMQNCKIKEIDFDTTVKMLVKGLDAMGRVKEQWEKMVRFFQVVSNIVKTSLSKTLNNFVKAAGDAKKLSYNSKLFAKDMLYNQVFQASNVASLVHMISGTYCEVSNKYLMDRVSSLGKLMAMDKEKPEFMQERLKLQNSCSEAQNSILQLVLKNKREFEFKTDARLAEIEKGLKAILPAAPPKETERIKGIVEEGFGKGEDNYI